MVDVAINMKKIQRDKCDCGKYSEDSQSCYWNTIFIQWNKITSDCVIQEQIYGPSSSSSRQFFNYSTLSFFAAFEINENA